MNIIAQLNDALNAAFLKDISVCKKKDKDLRDIAEETVYVHMPQAGVAWIVLEDGSKVQVPFVKTQDGFKFHSKNLGLPRNVNVVSVYTGDIAAAAIVYGVLGLSNKAAANRMAVLKKSPLFEKAEV
jgi:hypothetical protein